MAYYVHQAVVIVLVIKGAVLVTSFGCATQSNWFGSSCQYMCHCRTSKECNQTNGNCSGGVCEAGYSGSACQYVDLAYKEHTQNGTTLVLGRASDAVDGNKSSCLVSSLSQNPSWSVHLSNASWVTLILVQLLRVSDPLLATVDDLQMTCHNNVTKTQTLVTPYLAKITDTFFAYKFLNPIYVTSVELTVAANKSLALCDVAVLGGRNIALKKNAIQGEGTYNQAIADAAVDGNPDGNFQAGSCSHADGMKQWWKVHIGNWQQIWQFQVYNRQDSNPYRLANFRVNVTYANGSTYQIYQFSDLPPPLTNVVLDKPIQGNELTFWHEERFKILTLCEVVISGDCLDGFFGWDCNNTCNCQDPKEICDKVWGSCSYTGCRAGWTGLSCDAECSPGTHGFACATTCSSDCQNNSCHHVTGDCLSGCTDGWEGPRCDIECKEGTYGPNCALSCSIGCVHHLCHHLTGECSAGCNAGWLENNCTKSCGLGFYGYNCSQSCSTYCLNSYCETASGKCIDGCVPDQIEFCHFHDDNADQKANAIESGYEDSQHVVIVGSVVGVLALLLLLLLVVIVIKYKKWGGFRSQIGRLSSDPARDKFSTSDRTNKEEDFLQPSHFPSTIIDDQGDSISASSEKLKRKQMNEHSKASLYMKEIRPNSSRLSMNKSTPKPELMALFSRDAPGNDSRHSKAKSLVGICHAHLNHPVMTESYNSLDNISDYDLEILPCHTPPTMRRPVEGSEENYYNIVYRDESIHTAIPVKDLPNRVAYMLAYPKVFSKERSMLPEGKIAEWQVAVLPQNIKKNRYRYIYPYDHSRVLLQTLSGDPTSDYYNACFIDGLHREKQYVAAQGPTARTVSDFVRMVWELDIPCIVMLTNTVEMGQYKCEQYWPQTGSKTIGDITITVTNTISFADFCVRDLSLEKGREVKNVKHLHYTAWPDNSAPVSPWSFLSFWLQLRQISSGKGCTIVHCSAGIGRTGTFIALDQLLECVKEEESVDVFTCVWKLRQQRINMVQTLAQYIFIHEVLVAAVMTSVPVPLLKFRLDTIQIDEEFKNLQICLMPPVKKNDKPGGDQMRVQSETLLDPMDINRVSQIRSDSFRSSYVNVSFLPSYMQNYAFIQTHTPTSRSAIFNFITMVTQHKVKRIVCMDSEHDSHIHAAYLPNKPGEIFSLAQFSVELLQQLQDVGFSVQSLRIHYPTWSLGAEDGEGQMEQDCLDVMHFAFSEWPKNSAIPTSVFAFLSLVESCSSDCESPILVHCRDGFTKSGLFCAFSTILERILVEDHVAVNYVTAHLRVLRHQNIVSVEQYTFLYRCVQQKLQDIENGKVRINKFNILASQDCMDNLYGNIDHLVNKDEPVYGNVIGTEENILEV